MLSRPLNELQKEILRMFKVWQKTEDTPIPINEIIIHTDSVGFNKTRTIRAVRSLVKKHYIRSSVDRSSRSSYVKLKNF